LIASLPRAPRAALMVAPALLLAACYTGSARTVSADRLAAVAAEPGWLLVRDVPFVRQQTTRDCGAAALAMVLGYWKLPTSTEEISERFPEDGNGLRAGHLRDLARAKGLEAYLISGQLRDLENELGKGRPVLVGVAKPYRTTDLAHYEVVVGFHHEKRLVLTLDPAIGWRENTLEGFAREWVPTNQVTLVAFPRPAISQTGRQAP
jgi:ABC-type bacteriocin/lantibiotic exporter with double-glycine peptidase domain